MSVHSKQPAEVYCHGQSVAQQFLSESHTRAADSGCLEAWRQGRDRYFCWVVEIASEPILTRIDHWQQQLAPWLLSDYQRQPHLTIAIGGFWRPELRRRTLNDDFLSADLEQQLRLLSQFPCSTLELAVLGCNSFLSAPFLEVIDGSGGALTSLRQILIPTDDDFRSVPYCPHITLGLYKQNFPTSELSFLMDASVDREPLPLSVSHVSLMSYDSRYRCASLRLEQRVALGATP